MSNTVLFSDASTEASSSTESPVGKFEIQRLYLKKQMAEVPYASGIFHQTSDVKPETTVEMKIELERKPV